MKLVQNNYIKDKKQQLNVSLTAKTLYFEPARKKICFHPERK